MKSFISKYPTYITLIGVLVGLITACNKSVNETATEPSSKDSTLITINRVQFKNAEIQFGKLTSMELPVTVKANGILDVPPQNLASVSVPMGGYVRVTSVLPGTHVHEGEILAELENLDFIRMQQDYLMATNKLEMTEKEFERQKQLNTENISALKDFQNATMEVKNARAIVASLEQQLILLGVNMNKLKSGTVSPRIYVRSPINGNVKAVNVSLGKYVNPMDALYEIVDNSHMHMELQVFENDILRVKEKQKIVFSIPSIGKETFVGSVFLVGKTFNSTSRSILVHGHMDKEDKTRLIPGMFVEASIITQNEKSWVIPEDALVRQDNAYYLFVKKSETTETISFALVPVSVGYIVNKMASITGDITDFKEVEIVINGAYFIKAEMNKEEE